MSNNETTSQIASNEPSSACSKINERCQHTLPVGGVDCCVLDSCDELRNDDPDLSLLSRSCSPIIEGDCENDVYEFDLSGVDLIDSVDLNFDDVNSFDFGFFSVPDLGSSLSWVSRFSVPSVVHVPSYCLNYISQLPKWSKRNKDKLLWICDEILSLSQKDLEEGAPINSSFIRARLGGRSEKLLHDLEKFHLIERCANHSGGLKCRRYRFTRWSKIKVVPATLVTASLIDRRGDRVAYQKSRVTASGLSDRYLDHLRRFEPSPKFEGAMNKFIKQSEKKGVDVGTVKFFRDLILNDGFMFSVKHSRIWHPFSSLPPSARSCLLVDGQATDEFDFSNSHPCILAPVFAPPEGADNDVIMEHQEFIDLVSGCDFYERFADCWASDRKVFVDYATKDAADDAARQVAEELFLANTSRKGIKLCFQVLLNGNSKPTRLFNTKLWIKFSAMFPNISARMSQLRRTAPRRLGDELRRREAKMMGEVVAKMSSPCITIYDSFICAKDAEAELMEVCRELTLKHLGFVHLPIRKD